MMKMKLRHIEAILRPLLTLLISIFIVILFLNALSGLMLVLTGSMNIEQIHPPPKANAYGNWFGVIIGVALFSFFVLSYILPMSKREWRSAGIYEAFIMALFTEMYGFPLTIYILSSFFGVRLSLDHVGGHLLATMLGMSGILDLKMAWAAVMVVSSIIMFIGFVLIAKGWKKVYRTRGGLVKDGIYRHVRHPQYLGIMIITAGMLVQWPTLLTLAMWPILAMSYYSLAKREERDLEKIFGETYLEYKHAVPMFFPNLSSIFGQKKSIKIGDVE